MKTKRLWWIASVPQMIGVIALAGRFLDPGTCFATMLVGSALSAVAAWRDTNYPLVFLNGVYTATNILGLMRWG